MSKDGPIAGRHPSTDGDGRLPDVADPSGQSRMSAAAGGLLCVVLLLALHRYPGIAHDSILYMGEAMAEVYPAIFANDLFFAHGNQSSYSLLPWVLGKLLAIAPAPQLFLWAALSSLFLFAVSSWLVLEGLLPQTQRYWALLGIACLPGIYGVVHIFSYNESFVTARPFAESFCLLAVAAFARQRWLAAAAALLAGWALHPLQALAATMVIWPWLVLRDRRWLHALWLVIPLLGAAWLGIAPLDGLVQRTDGQWLASLQHSSQLYLLKWGANDYKAAAFDACLLAIAWKALPAGYARWCLAALIGLVLGFGASLVLVDGMHLSLPTSLQLWRVQWLAHWFAIGGFAALLYQHGGQGEVGRALALMMAAQLAWGETQLGWMAMLAIYIAWPALTASTRQRLAPVLTYIFALALVLLFANHASNEWKWFAAAGHRLEVYPVDLRLLMFPALALALPLGALWLWHRAAGPARLALVAFGLAPALCWAAATWDARKPQDLAFERQADQPSLFGVSIPPSAQVFWTPENLLGNWLILRRASYYSDGQMAGQMFNRATAIEGIRKADRLRTLREASLRCLRDHATADGQMHCQIDDQAILRACAPGAPAPPDFIVMPHIQPGVQAWRWDVRDPTTGQVALSYRLYRCDALLQAQRVRARSATAVSK